MEPIVLAGAFAQIVGLVSIFSREHQSQETLTKQDFDDWLDNHGFSEIKALIIDTQGLTVEVEQLLKEDRELLLRKLAQLEEILAAIMSRMDYFSGIARALKPGSQLSDQSVHILRKLVRSGEHRFLRLYHEGSSLTKLVLPASKQEIPILESVFLTDDLDILVKLGFLHLEVHSAAVQYYVVTRNAANFVAALPSADPGKGQCMD